MFGRSKSLVPLAASLTLSAVLSSPAFASSLCSDDRATRAVREIVQNAVPEWSVDLAADFGDWARVERVKNLTKITAVASIRAVSHDKDTQLTNCIAKVTFDLDDHRMSPEISYTVQPLEDKPDALHVEVDPPYKTRVVNRVPAAPTPAPLPAPQTTVVVNNSPAAQVPVPSIGPVIVMPPAIEPPKNSSPMFAKGLSDRTIWANWYTSLAEGSFKSGVEYWASHRSLANPGPCEQISADFTAGCLAAKIRLTPSDVLRKSDPDYRLGWNSYVPSSSLTANNMSCWDLSVARNEVFARRGYAFKNAELSAYFSRQSWYHPFMADISTIILSPAEDRQIDVIKTAEAKRGCVAP